ncbi:MAG: DoxX family protein [Actinomycetia bacterium]|nr:DoxX family protein [Actinomycetes bacterium]MCH9736128.1 DoxX family protein [Actinomycetes bacterium]
MSSFTVSTTLQVIVALGLLNVWLVRARTSTAYRGGTAQSLKEEFATYGLPEWSFYAVGALKVGSAVLLLVGIWVPALIRPPALIVSVLMIGALAMHAKAKDSPVKFLPAFVMLIMCVAIFLLQQ